MYSSKPTQQIFHNFNAPKIQAKILSTTSQITNIAKIHEPPTLSKLHHDQKIQQFKNAPKPRLQHGQPCNASNFNKTTQQHNDNVPTSNSQWNMKTTFFPKKKKTHLEVHVEHGSWGLERTPLHHSIQVMDDISSHEK